MQQEMHVILFIRNYNFYAKLHIVLIVCEFCGGLLVFERNSRILNCE